MSMDTFVVSARKYRPATFGTVVGQSSITNTLKNAIRNEQLAQAFLFCGPRGVGKTTCARILAKTINCQQLTPEIEPCNTCDSCVSFNRSASFNVYELDAASNNSVEDIRKLVDQVRIPPQAGKYKIYIIDEVHMLSLAAFNAFLKTLEEPPAYAKFILATTEKHKIIPTILSRCQIFDFKRITVEDIATHLAYVGEKEGVKAEKDALQVIALKADGSLRDALSIFDQLVSFSGNELSYKDVIENLNVLDFEYYFRMTDHLLAGDYRAALLLIHEILGNGFDGQHFLGGLGEHFRNLLVARDASTAALLEVAESYRQRYHQQASQCEEGFILKMLDQANRADMNYKAATNKPLHLEIAILQMAAGNLATPAEDVKKKTADLQNPVIRNSQPATAAAPATKSASLSTGPKPASSPSSAAGAGAEKPAAKARIGLNLDSKIANHSTVSLKEKEEEKEDDSVETEAGDMPETPFNEEDLQMYWQAFSNGFRDEKPSLFSTLAGGKPVLNPGWQLRFEVANRVQHMEMESIKADLLHFLRSKLDNAHISLQVEIVKKENGQGKPYTPQDKFKHLAGKNPAVQELKDRLNLEIDY